MSAFLLMESTVGNGGIQQAEKRVEEFFARLDTIRLRPDGTFINPPDFETEVRSYLAMMVKEIQTNSDNTVGRLLLMNAVALAKYRKIRDEKK